MKNLLKPLPKSILTTLGLSAAVTTANSGIPRKILGSGMKTLIISNEKIHDVMKIIKPLEESGSLRKDDKTKNKANEKKGGFAAV